MKCVKATIFSDVDGKGGYRVGAFAGDAVHGRDRVVVRVFGL